MKSAKLSFVTTLLSVSSLTVGTLTVGAFAAFPALADPAKGLEIAEQRKAVDLGGGESVATMEMLLRNQQGESSARQMRFTSLDCLI